METTNININTNNIDENIETFDFEAEVPQVMSLIINSVYSSKEMFLRELISNASDAISKIKTRKNELESKGYSTYPIGSYKIQIIPDKKNNTLIIKDNGIGMTKNDLISFLGSIASSGTKKFREAMNNNKTESIDSLIGQFGLGFYSAFLVASKVELITKNPMDEGYYWSSIGNNSYSISKYDTKDTLHGTTIILTLKEGEKEYLESSRLIELIKKHSLYIKYPISVLVEKALSNNKKEDDLIDGEAKQDDNVDGGVDGDVVEELKDNNDNDKVIFEEQIINNEIPIWTKKVDDIPQEDLNKFYRTLSNDYDDYAAVQSWHFEGMIDLKILLFIPKKAKMNFFEKQNEKNTNIKVFNSNVFVTDDLGKDVVPDWMNFIVGAVSSSDFPMNISREFLQGKAVMNLLKTKLPKCIAEMLKKLEKDEEKYNQIYKEFSSNIKLAVRQYSDSQQEIYAKFLRYPVNNASLLPVTSSNASNASNDKNDDSSNNKDNSNKMISLDQYLEALPENTTQILYLTGLSKKDVETSLCLEAFNDRLVLLMSEAIDEIMLQGLKKYKGIELQNISIEGVNSINPISDEIKKEYEPFTNKIKEILKGNIDKVEISNRFESVPVSILTSKYGNSSTMENILKAQPGIENNPMLMMMMKSRKILEINIDSPVIKELKKKFENNEEEELKFNLNFIYNAALIGSGFTIEDKSSFIKDLYKVLYKSVV